MLGGYDRGNVAVSAAVERLSVVAGTNAWKRYATTAIFADYFKQRTKLNAAKAMTAAAVDTGRYVFPDAPYTPTGAVVVTRSNLAVRAGVGQDWWTNTPFFNLASDTNGFRFIPAVMTNLLMIQLFSAKTFSNNVVWFAYGSSGTSFSDAMSDAASKWDQGYLSYNDIGASVETYFRFDEDDGGHFHFEVWVNRYTGDCYVDPSLLSKAAMTNIGSKVMVWNRFYDPWSGAFGFDPVFNAQGDSGVSTNWSVLWDWSYAKTDTAADLPASIRIGSTGPSTMPPNYTLPPESDTGMETGWSLNKYGAGIPDRWIFTHRYDVDDGFQWFK
jgi:hypothetical protein